MGETYGEIEADEKKPVLVDGDEVVCSTIYRSREIARYDWGSIIFIDYLGADRF